MSDLLQVICGDALSELRNLPDESVHCCVTSPPYWGLRDYSTNGQLGLEKTPDEYVANMVEIFAEVRRVLRRDGTLWMNMGDSIQNKQLQGIPWRVAFALQADGWWLRSDIIWAKPNPMPESVTDRPTKSHEYLFLLAKSASYYYDAEAIKEKADPDRNGQLERSFSTSDPESSLRNDVGRAVMRTSNRNKRSVWTVATAPYPEAHFATYPPHLVKPCIMAGTSAKGCCARCGAPWERIVERSGGNIGILGAIPSGTLQEGKNTQPSWNPPNSDYKVKIKTLGWKPTCYCEWEDGITQWPGVIPCTVLDPFAGSGTTGAVALELGRKAVLIELNSAYVELIEQRCSVTPGLQLA